ncbi:GtrA family protein [Streptantibioticus ferralitis]|uniref:GtrA family protein n=1 Tax=Streptantibioticus ferralitis TaxID=236510 RepID=A0ABT5Z6C6_9ACTN|nr:GtrA family protein [Streptantibioticus ferralitis]MDF2259386.1 GtrA family protein [Streptantibioticus ferralitis]
MPSPTQTALRRVPPRMRPFLVQHRELVKFLVVGGACLLLTTAVNYGLKFTVFRGSPISAFTVANIVATLVSYLLNRQWSFRSTGQHRREAVLFVVVSGLGILLSDVPLWVAHYLLNLRIPHVSAVTQAVSDFISSLIVGTLLGTGFRWWAMKKWVFLQPVTVHDLSNPAVSAHSTEPAA